MSYTINPIKPISINTKFAENNNYSSVPLTKNDEDEFLKKVDKYIIKKEAKLHTKSKLENFTLKELFDNLYKVLYDIINDISVINFAELNNYDTPNTKWWQKYIKLFEKIINILFMPERAFYIGVIFIFIAFCLYFIDLTN